MKKINLNLPPDLKRGEPDLERGEPDLDLDLADPERDLEPDPDLDRRDLETDLLLELDLDDPLADWDRERLGSTSGRSHRTRPGPKLLKTIFL